MHITPVVAALLLAASVSMQQDHAQHQHPQSRAQQGMEFDQERTTHHFLIEKDGGTIQVTARDAADRTSADQIRGHLQHIASVFAKGDFSLPMFIHETDPPGIAIMKERRSAMTFAFEEIANGGRVVIRTRDAAARDALHDFLRFQIREHRTGDPMNPRQGDEDHGTNRGVHDEH
ncbi:MAG TPA: hypothetical protein VFJ02_04010 [Vicinamibacterales bacterium]|nr:hypothetical protein [Vicinamibacterales bacterium]